MQNQLIFEQYCMFCGEPIGSHQCGWSSGPYDAGMGFHVDGSGPIHGRFETMTGNRWKLLTIVISIALIVTPRK